MGEHFCFKSHQTRQVFLGVYRFVFVVSTDAAVIAIIAMTAVAYVTSAGKPTLSVSVTRVIMVDVTAGAVETTVLVIDDVAVVVVNAVVVDVIVLAGKVVVSVMVLFEDIVLVVVTLDTI